jgi:hypothetical protein
MENVTDKSTELLCPLGVDTPTEAILVWEFYSAPEFMRKLSDNGGDEDGICWIPTGYEKPYWIDRLWDVFGGPQAIQFKDGMLVIWAHS